MKPEITVYEKPTCTTCRKLAILLKEHGYDYDAVNYFIDPLDKTQLEALLKKAGMLPFEVLRTREKLVAELGLSPETPHDELLNIIVANPNILQRPIVEIGDKAVIARPIEKALELIRSSK